ncbi:LysR family transcriptional regulator [Cobetia amphilecti]|uniref:LysR family transcriptional regulator n=1 Tax=Cobetia amphilecti TaxID=1055104 RepID=UPI00244D57C4|nr:LysR family transcriptional regulator [Cobetia litoralis]MDH2420117.1 LysR family transcriptional regulator [Cobetia litoralis]MDH2422486.1 LysR family transcriptional regulator [Cobetia litoralis]
MKIEWIEDFLALIEAGTFSLAAERRNVTQPAFSRRIRQLEEWLGVELVYRQSQRMILTEHALEYEQEMREWLTRLYTLRSRLRSEARQGPKAIITTQHTLTVSYLPRLLRYFRHNSPEAGLQVKSLDRSECLQLFEHDQADLLLCSELQGAPIFDDNGDTQRISLGLERLLPVCAPDAQGRPLHLPRSDQRLPLIAYDPESFLGQILASPYLMDLQRAQDVDIICETSFTLGIRELVMAGLGVGWLPHGLIEDDLESGRLVSLLDDLGGPTLEVACYCRRGKHSAATESLWQLLNESPPSV